MTQHRRRLLHLDNFFAPILRGAFPDRFEISSPMRILQWKQFRKLVGMRIVAGNGTCVAHLFISKQWTAGYANGQDWRGLRLSMLARVGASAHMGCGAVRQSARNGVSLSLSLLSPFSCASRSLAYPRHRYTRPLWTWDSWPLPGASTYEDKGTAPLNK